MGKLYKRTIISGLCVATIALAPSLAFADDTIINGDYYEIYGAGVKNSGDNNVAVGNVFINNEAITGNYGALVFEGDGNVAIGVGASYFDSSSGQKVIGYGAAAGRGNYNIALGTNAYAGGLPNLPGSDGNVAIGYGAIAYGNNSVALGQGSIASEPNTVSVGSYQNERRIMNVAPGYYDTDAVNMSQLRSLDSRVNRLGASAFALSALAPMAYDPKDPTQYSAGIGTYYGTQAIAVGVYHYTKPSVLLNAAFAMSLDGAESSWEKSARFGITWKTGGPKAKELIPAIAPDVKSNPNIVERINKIIDGDKASFQATKAASEVTAALDGSGKSLVKEAVPVENSSVKSDNIISRVNKILAGK